MDVLNAKDTVKFILDQAVSVREKEQRFTAYLSAKIALMSGILSHAQACRSALQDLEQAAEDLNVRNNLLQVLKIVAKLREQRVQTYKDQLRSITEGTSVVVQDSDQQKVVRFIKANRKYFICEFEDGKRWNVPFSDFVRVSETITKTEQRI